MANSEQKVNKIFAQATNSKLFTPSAAYYELPRKWRLYANTAGWGGNPF